MGTTVSSLQILGAPLEDVRAALPRTLVGQWSERFVTACSELTFQRLERKAGTLSKKLDCTILTVSMFDGDAVSLTVFQSGKRLTRHTVDPETGTHSVGNPKLFCSALGLPQELAPKLKRLFTDCSSQEGKLHILQALLGTPLFVRWDDPDDRFPMEPVQADTEPLERWIIEHTAPPKPPKIKNQCRAELVQEIADLICSGDFGGKSFLFRPPRSTSVWNVDTVTWLSMKYGWKEEYLLHVLACNGSIGRLLPDGRLELTPLEDPPYSDDLKQRVFGSSEGDWNDFFYAALGGRLITCDTLFSETGHQTQPYQTVIFWDSAGLLPNNFLLVRDGKPVAADKLFLLPDGGFLSADKRHELVGNESKTRLVHFCRFSQNGVFQHAFDREEDLPKEDAAAVRDILELERKWCLRSAATDGQGRIWQECDKYYECRSPEGKLLSRHRLPGHVAVLYCNDDGQVCAITNDWKKYVTRIYRFS